MIIFIIIMLVALDRYTKSMAKKGKINIKNSFLTTDLVKNKGAFRGLFKNNFKLLVGIQAISTIIVVGIEIISLIKKQKGLSVGLALLSAGAIGNLIDRIKDKEVTDWFAIRWTKNLYYNLADIYIFLGGIITVIKSL